MVLQQVDDLTIRILRPVLLELKLVQSHVIMDSQAPHKGRGKSPSSVVVQSLSHVRLCDPRGLQHVQVHVCGVSDAIQPSHALSPPFLCFQSSPIFHVKFIHFTRYTAFLM